MNGKIDKLIINSPYREPDSHWEYDHDREDFVRVSGRRRSGYIIARAGARKHDDEGRFIEIPLVNLIRERVRAWRESGYEGVTNTTRELLMHWHDDSVRRDTPFFFCQLDAIETLIFLTEAPVNLKTGYVIQGDGSEFRRLCTKLCTGGGKTIVMSMLIAWQVCNFAANPRDRRFTRNVFIVAPNLTVKKRLQVLRPSSDDESYYSRFQVVPSGMMELMNQANVIIQNWHVLDWETEEELARRKSVDKRGVKSDEVYAKEILGDMKNILVINDEAHHAYRLTPENSRGKTQDEKREATVWLCGLDRIHKARKILGCYDFSATPFVVQRKGRSDEEGLFTWIVSDFSLSDGIESGIVKTPRVVVRDNAPPDPETYKSKFYHIYADTSVRDNLNASAGDDAPLPDLVRNAYMLLAHDWLRTFREWQAQNRATPPVMISVANRTETASRIEQMFTSDTLNVPELSEHVLRIDSDVLRKAGTAESESLRELADTVGKEGMPGADVRNVISVGMLSEGWDARTVTHIMGLRAFTSQLLCEQVVGRGLRRTSYDVPSDESGMFAPEYVNVFGIPFAFLPQQDDSGRYEPGLRTTNIRALPEREEFRISWPDVLRLEYGFRQTLTLDVDAVPPIELNAETTRISAELSPVLDGKTSLTMCSDIDLERLYESVRTQRLIFDAAGRVYDVMASSWQKEGTKLNLLGQVIRLTEDYIEGGKISVYPERFRMDETRRRIIIAMNIERLITHMWEWIRSVSRERITPVLRRPGLSRSTGDMLAWWTTRPCRVTQKSHISHCVYDSAWEDSTAYHLERNPEVSAWAKNDHLGFYVSYVYGGILRRYVPDFFVRLKNGVSLILETKAINDEQAKTKRRALEEWCEAVNGVKGAPFGEWVCDVSRSPADVDGIIAGYSH